MSIYKILWYLLNIITFIILDLSAVFDAFPLKGSDSFEQHNIWPGFEFILDVLAIEDYIELSTFILSFNDYTLFNFLWTGCWEYCIILKEVKDFPFQFSCFKFQHSQHVNIVFRTCFTSLFSYAIHVESIYQKLAELTNIIDPLSTFIF